MVARTIVTGLTDAQLAEWEAAAELATEIALRKACDAGADKITERPVTAAAGDVTPYDLAVINEVWRAEVDQTLLPMMAEVWADSEGTVHAGMVDAAGLPLPDPTPEVQLAYLAQLAPALDDIGEQAWQNARHALVEGVEVGDSIPELADRVRASAGVTGRKATLAARTAVIGTANRASFETAKAVGLDDTQKQWSSSMDARVRPTHIRANGQLRPLNEPFTVGGWPADFPGDPQLPPPERYSCRCTILYAFDGEDPPIPVDTDTAPDTITGQPQAPTVPLSDGLDDLLDHQLRSLAVEWDLPVGQTSDRATTLAALRLVGAKAPFIRDQDAFPIRWQYPPDARFEAGADMIPDVDAANATMRRWVYEKVDDAPSGFEQEPAVSAALRGRTPMTDQLRGDVDMLDRLIASSATDRPVTVYRGYANGERTMPDDWEERDLTGLEWDDPGFVSVTDTFSAAEDFTGPTDAKGFLIEIRLPAGHRGVAVVDRQVSDDFEGATPLDDEGEIVLGRQTRFRVVEDKGFTEPYGIRHLVVEVVDEPTGKPAQLPDLSPAVVKPAGVPRTWALPEEMAKGADQVGVDAKFAGEPKPAPLGDTTDPKFMGGPGGRVGLGGDDRLARAVSPLGDGNLPKVGAPRAAATPPAPVDLKAARARFAKLSAESAKGPKALKAVPIRMSQPKVERIFEGFDQFTESERRHIQAAMVQYERSAFQDINVWLRSGRLYRKELGAWDALNEDEIKSLIADLNRAFGQSRLAEPVTVYRGLETGQGIFGPRDTWPDDLAGREWVEDGMFSTSATRAVADDFGQLQLRIVVPKGQRAIGMSGTGRDQEGEILLPPGSRFRVVKDRGVGADGKRRLDVEVVTDEPTPAGTPAPPPTAAVIDRPLSRLPVAELRDIARAEGVTVPPKALKKDLIAAIERSRATRTPDEPPARTLAPLNEEGSTPPIRSLPPSLDPTSPQSARVARSAEAKRLGEAPARLLGNLAEGLDPGDALDVFLAQARVSKLGADDIAPIVRALRDGDVERAVTETEAFLLRSGLSPVRQPGEVLRYRPSQMIGVDGSVLEEGAPVRVVFPGVSRLEGGKPQLVVKARVQPIAPEESDLLAQLTPLEPPRVVSPLLAPGREVPGELLRPAAPVGGPAGAPARVVANTLDELYDRLGLDDFERTLDQSVRLVHESLRATGQGLLPDVRDSVDIATIRAALPAMTRADLNSVLRYMAADRNVDLIEGPEGIGLPTVNGRPIRGVVIRPAGRVLREDTPRAVRVAPEPITPAPSRAARVPGDVLAEREQMTPTQHRDLLRSLGVKIPPKATTAQLRTLATHPRVLEFDDTLPFDNNPDGFAALPLGELRDYARWRYDRSGLVMDEKATAQQLLRFLRGDQRATPDRVVKEALQVEAFRAERATRVAELIGEALELVGKQADLPTIRKALRATVNVQMKAAGSMGGGAGGEAAQAELAGVLDALKAADVADRLDAIAARYGLGRVGDVSEVVEFDPNIHRSVSAATRPGDRVRVLRPGFTVDRDGQAATLLRADVAPDAGAPSAPATTFPELDAARAAMVAARKREDAKVTKRFGDITPLARRVLRAKHRSEMNDIINEAAIDEAGVRALAAELKISIPDSVVGSGKVRSFVAREVEKIPKRPIRKSILLPVTEAQRTAAAAALRARAAQAPRILDMLSDSTDPGFNPEASARLQAAFAEVLEGEYPGGLRIVDVSAHQSGDVFNFGGAIQDAAGETVGYFDRFAVRENGKWREIHHHKFFLDPEVQGSGLANMMNRVMFDWYRRSGFKQVTVGASDIGSYTWASTGFDFADRAALRAFLDQDSGSMIWDSSGIVAPGRFTDEYKEQRALLDALIARAERGEWVSAYEFSQVGRKPGQGKLDWWIGKEYMLRKGGFTGKKKL